MKKLLLIIFAVLLWAPIASAKKAETYLYLNLNDGDHFLPIEYAFRTYFGTYFKLTDIAYLPSSPIGPIETASVNRTDMKDGRRLLLDENGNAEGDLNDQDKDKTEETVSSAIAAVSAVADDAAIWVRFQRSSSRPYQRSGNTVPSKIHHQ